MSQTINALPESVKSSLKVVTREQLFRLRLAGRKFVAIKSGDKFYVAFGKSSDIIEIRAAFGKHKCGDCANFYNKKTHKLCPKVADSSEEVCRSYTASAIDALRESKRMEKYTFIEEGVEYVNSPRGFFAVAKCSKFKEHEADSRRLDERELSREWFERERELTKELEAKRPEYSKVFYQFGFNPQ